MAEHHPPHHEISLPAFSTAMHSDLAALPASTRTSYTRVDLTRPATRLSQLSNDDSRSRSSRSGDDNDDAPEPSDEYSNHAEDAVEEREPEVPVSPQTFITFLLVSGRRRNMSFEPETTVGRVKELVWNTWPNDWQDERPPAPSYLRILYLGKVLQDDDTLSHLSFPTHLPVPHSNASTAAPSPPSTIVHLSIRAFAPPGDDGMKKKRRLSHWGENGGTTDVAVPVNGGEHNGGCCGCVIS